MSESARRGSGGTGNTVSGDADVTVEGFVNGGSGGSSLDGRERWQRRLGHNVSEMPTCINRKLCDRGYGGTAIRRQRRLGVENSVPER